MSTIEEHKGTLLTLDTTKSLGAILATCLNPGTSLALCGDLGTGKTTLTRSIVESLGCTEPVSSPTFVLCHEYHTPSGLFIEHWDLYRISSLPEALEEDTPRDTVRIIEWADRFEQCLTESTIRMTMTLSATGERTYVLTTTSTDLLRRVTTLNGELP